jgi:hypothetical protein
MYETMFIGRMPGDGIRHGEPKKLPARLNDAWDEPIRREFAESEARNFETPDESATPAAHFATVYHPRWARISGKLAKAGIVLLGLELGAHGSILLDRRAFPLVTIDPGHFRHRKADLSGLQPVCKWVLGS